MEPKPADRELVFQGGSVAAGQSFTITGLIGKEFSSSFWAGSLSVAQVYPTDLVVATDANRPDMPDDLSKIRQAPDPVSARSPVAESPDTTQEEHGKTDQLLLKAKRQYQAACRGEDRLRKDMLDDRRFRAARGRLR